MKANAKGRKAKPAVPVTIFPSGTATQGTEQRATLADIARYLDREHGPRYPDDKDADDAEKKRQPLLKLGRFENQSRRKGSTVLDHQGLALDYDDPATPMAEAAERLRAAGIAALLYPTWKGLPRYRVVALFSGPLPADADLEHAAKPVTGLIGPASRESFDPARGFFIGRPLGEPREPIVIEGECMAPEYVPVRVKERAPPGNGGERIGHGERNTRLAAIAGALRRQRCDEEAIYAALAAVNAEQCDPPLEESEVRAIARSIAGYAPGTREEVEALRAPARLVAPIDWQALSGRRAPPRYWLMEDWLGANPTLLAGAPGSGKTLVGQQLGSVFTLGRDFFGRFTGGRPLTVLMWACEDDEDELWRRQENIALWLNVDVGAFAGKLHVIPRVGLDNTLYLGARDGAAMPTALMKMLGEQVNDLKADVLLLDNVGQVFGANESDRHQVTTFINLVMGLVRGRAFTPVFLAHPARGGASEFAGSAAWEAAVRMRWYLGPTLPGVPTDRDAPVDPRSTVRYLCKRKTNYSAMDYVQLQYKGGVYEMGMPIMDGHERVALEAATAKDAVIAAARRLMEMNREFVEASNSPDSLITQIVNLKLDAGLSKPALKAGMLALIAEQRLVQAAGQYSNRNPRKVLRLAEAQGAG